MDLCLARAHSDLTDADTKSFWISRIKAGQVIGLGGGPSCETWSAARFASPGPKPLRSYDKPWGIEGLSSHQWKQVLTGTKLIQFLVDLLVGGSSVRPVRLPRTSTVSTVDYALPPFINMGHQGDPNLGKTGLLQHLFL